MFVQKLKCKYCADEFDVIGNLYFHVRMAHANKYWKQIVPGIVNVTAKIQSYAYPAKESMKGLRDSPVERRTISNLF